MNITIPTTVQIGTALERTARAIAITLSVAIATAHIVYGAGLATGRAVHALSDWLADATHRPLESATAVATAFLAWEDRILGEPEPAPDLIALFGARVLTDAEMDAEIAQYDARTLQKRPAARRKPAGARKPAMVA